MAISCSQITVNTLDFISQRDHNGRVAPALRMLLVPVTRTYAMTIAMARAINKRRCGAMLTQTEVHNTNGGARLFCIPGNVNRKQVEHIFS